MIREPDIVIRQKVQQASFPGYLIPSEEVIRIDWKCKRNRKGYVYISSLLLAGFCCKSAKHCRVYGFLKSCLTLDIGSLLIVSVGESLDVNL